MFGSHEMKHMYSTHNAIDLTNWYLLLYAFRATSLCPMIAGDKHSLAIRAGHWTYYYRKEKGELKNQKVLPSEHFFRRRLPRTGLHEIFWFVELGQNNNDNDHDY